MACQPGPGSLTCALTACGAGTTDQTCLRGSEQGFCCDGACVENGSGNCGACGRPCGDAGPGCGVGANNGACFLSDGGDGFCCQGTCDDSAAQEAPNCGACGLSCTACQSDIDCPAGQACAISGGGQSSLGYSCAAISCSGAVNGTACAIPGLVDDSDCCGNQVAQENQSIWGSELVGTECCGGACVDLEHDPANCGVCGVACPAGTACQFARCQPAVDCAQASEGTGCPFSATAEGICCSGLCVDPASDNANCLNCGLTCPPGTVCTAEECMFPDGGMTRPIASPACGGLADGTLCDYGSDAGYMGSCCSGACVWGSGSLSTCAACGYACPPCNSGCPGGTTCVNAEGYDSCLPLACGGEGNGDACAFGPETAGIDYVIPGIEAFRESNGSLGSSACCSAVCADLSQDPSNCGACGAACPSGMLISTPRSPIS